MPPKRIVAGACGKVVSQLAKHRPLALRRQSRRRCRGPWSCPDPCRRRYTGVAVAWACARVGADVPLCGVTFVAGTRRGSRTGFTRKVAQTQSLQGPVQRKIVPVLACVRRGVAMVLACRVCSLLGAPQFTVDEELGLVDGDLATVHSVCHPV